MRKLTIFLFSFVLIMGCFAIGLCQHEDNISMEEKEKDRMVPKHEMMMKMEKMMEMRSMESRQVISTSDGGVVILSGNTLSKYDSNLNLVKEVELKAKEAMPKKQFDKPMPPMDKMKRER